MSKATLTCNRGEFRMSPAFKRRARPGVAIGRKIPECSLKRQEVTCGGGVRRRDARGIMDRRMRIAGPMEFRLPLAGAGKHRALSSMQSRLSLPFRHRGECPSQWKHASDATTEHIQHGRRHPSYLFRRDSQGRSERRDLLRRDQRPKWDGSHDSDAVTFTTRSRWMRY